MFVPHLGVNIAFLFVLASVVIFLFYIHHIAQSIRVATIIASIGAETRDLIERRLPGKPDEPDAATPFDGQVAPHRIVTATRPGIVVAVNDAMLIRLAESTGSVVQLLRGSGNLCRRGRPTPRVRCARSLGRAAVRRHPDS